MSDKIDWAGWPQTYDRVILDQVDSTMSEAARRASDILRPTWILAHHQTAGRGRRGRAWENPKGNFAATLLMRPQGSPEQAALRSFVAALALYDCLSTVVDPAKLSLKWPNDVLLSGGKVAGILLEAMGQGADVLSIGIGINLATAPAPAQLEARAMAPVALADHTPAKLPPEGVLFELATAFARWEDRFTTYGFEPIRTAWLQQAARLGQPITARTALTETTGTFETVDEGGNLVLRTAKGRVAIAAADVYF